ncbi:hypothetical protein HZH66_015319 [Vespula vulgaris]|uniref:Uncharacterized protein n=1 Tax=Vespula vulgaris TaxID=7454 RepID=A0A834MN60_VESVU|nr:hypothetical protein HZH66_015319 [Vespula vulgaris]
MQKHTMSTVQSLKEFRTNQTEIKDLNIKNILGYDLINGKILNTKKIKYITILFNTIMRLEYFPLQWKFAKIILLLKPGKPIEIPSSYTPISLLSISFKIPRKNHSEAFNKTHNKTPNYSTTVLFQELEAKIKKHNDNIYNNDPLRVYGINLWSTATKSNLKKIKTTQSKLLRMILYTPQYVRNDSIEETLEVTPKRISTHENPMRKDCMLPIPRRSHRINTPIGQLLSTPIRVLVKVRNEQILKVE